MLKALGGDVVKSEWFKCFTPLYTTNTIIIINNIMNSVFTPTI